MISENHSDYNGGGIYCYSNGTIAILNSTLSKNSSNQSGGAIYFFGPSSNVMSSLSIQDCTINENTASGKGGAIYLTHVSNNSTSSFNTSTFTANSAFYGGALYYHCAFSNLELTNVTITKNIAIQNGAALRSSYNTIIIGSSIVTGDLYIPSIFF